MAEVGERTVSKNEGIGVQVSSVCLLCGSQGMLLYQNLRDRLFSAPGTWSLMRCEACDLCWLNPRPLPTEIGKLYEVYHTHSVAFNQVRLAGLRVFVKGSILRSSYGYQQVDGGNPVAGWLLSRVGPLRELAGGPVLWLHAKERGRLLDVGCGNGQFLARMRQLGWEVVGVEPDPEAVRIARDRFSLEVIQGTLAEAQLPEASFDAITMNHVIEHVPDPVELLAECRRVLKPGGKLVLVTPNIRSLGRRIFGEHWRGWEVPRHLFLFSPRSLRACAERAGLEIQELWTTAKGARWMWAASRLIRQNGRLPGGSPNKLSFWLWLEGLAFWAVEHGLGWLRDAGEEVVLIATK